MTFDAWLALAVAITAMILLALERYPPALVMAAAVAVLLVGGIIDEQQALSGFANQAPATVAALYVLAGAADVTGALDQLTLSALGKKRIRGSARRHLSRVAYPAMAASALIANTPLVGMIAPQIVSWCRRSAVSPSRYLMPLSYAVIFGGCITLMGTSTNLVIAGLLEESGQEAFGLFEITPVGLPLALLGTTLTILLAPRLLSERRAPSEDFERQMREFTVEMEVDEKSPLAGRTVTEAGLRNLEGVFLVGLERHGRSIAPVAPEETLAEKDRLLFAGNVSRIVDLQRLPGLAFGQERHLVSSGDGVVRQFYQAIVGDSSPVVGRTLKQVGFRARYGAAVFAIHRAGERIAGKLGEVRLRPGDALILMADKGFGRRWEHDTEFLSLAPLGNGRPVRRENARAVRLLLGGMVAAAALGLVSLLEASLLTAIALVGLGIVTPSEALRSVDLQIILLMALSFGVAAAIHQSGLAIELANGIVAGFRPLGDIGILAGILVATMLLTELLSNNAAAVLMFPIAMATAQQAGLQPRPFAAVILFGASLSFLTPVGYQANTLVWSMGGYRFRDFTRLGAPLTLTTIAVTLAVVPVVFPLR